MKRTCLSLILSVIPGLLGAQQDMKFSLGANGGIAFYNLDDRLLGVSQGWNTTNFTAGVFFDATYVRAGIGFETYLAGYSYITGSGTTDFTDTRISCLNLTVLGKYPFALGPVTLWPAVGPRYAIALQYVQEGVDRLAAADPLSDFYLMLGVGADFRLGGFFITVQALYGLNLTPNPTGAPPAWNETMSGSDIELTAGFGFAF